MGKPVRKVVFFLDTRTGDSGRLAAAEFNAVAEKLGLPWVARTGDTPDPTASVVIAFDRNAAASGLPTPLPEGTTVEVWESTHPDRKQTVAEDISKLIARLLGGWVVADEPAPAQAIKEAPKKVHTVRVGRETAGRRGKGVTTVFDLPLTEDGMKELATTLKQKCGTGGTVKDGRIEIQGDHRDRIAAELEKLGYRVKRAGG